MSRITDKVSLLARPVVEEAGCTLWDVEYVREAGRGTCAYIDKDGGVSIDDCERISRELDPILSTRPTRSRTATFLKSAPPVRRGSSSARRFRAVHGQRGRGEVYQPLDGAKSFVGILKAYSDDGTVTVASGKKELSFTKAQTAQVRLHVSI